MVTQKENITKTIRCLVEGAQSVGKTTLISSVSRRIIDKEMEIIPVWSIARELADAGFGHDYQTGIADYYMYYAKHLENWRTSKEGILLFERSLLDVIVYSRLLLGPGHQVEKLGIELYKIIEKEINAVVYLPIEFYPVPDGFRDASVESQKAFDRILLDIMNELAVPYQTITGSIEVRSQNLIDFLYNIIRV